MFERTLAVETDASGDEDAGTEVAGDTETESNTDTAHLDDVADGCGCTEIWEHLSERRTDE